MSGLLPVFDLGKFSTSIHSIGFNSFKNNNIEKEKIQSQEDLAELQAETTMAHHRPHKTQGDANK